MHPLKLSLLLVFLITLFTGCESYRQSVRDLGNGMGLVGTRDLNHLEAWQTALYKNSGYTRQQIEVTPGAGVTHITIREVRPGEDAVALTANLQNAAAANRDLLGSIEVATQLRR